MLDRLRADLGPGSWLSAKPRIDPDAPELEYVQRPDPFAFKLRLDRHPDPAHPAAPRHGPPHPRGPPGPGDFVSHRAHVLRIDTDARQLSFAAGCSEPALTWVRDYLHHRIAHTRHR